MLDDTEYRTDATFDALGRRRTSTAPLDNTGSRAVITFEYGRSGGITRLSLDGVPYLQQVAYDPHGRRCLAQLGNGVLLRYLYDPRTLRLRRWHAQPATGTATMAQPDGTTTTTAWQTSGTVVQDHTYRYDPAGNLLTIGDRTPGSGLPAGVDPIHSPDKNTLDRVFGYDALNRLLTATGRETDTVPGQPWDDNPRRLDVTKARAYTETYTYDAVGNLSALDHDTNTAGTGAYTRTYTPAPDSNQLSSMSVSGNLTGTYTYDAVGNLTGETTTRHFEWDHANRLATFRVQTDGATPSKYAQYRYDATGERAVKLVRMGAAQDEITIYVGGFERSLTGSIAGQLTPYDEIHLTDHDTRLAMIQRGDTAPRRRDHRPAGPVPGSRSPRKRHRHPRPGRNRPQHRGVPALRRNLFRQLPAQAIPPHRPGTRQRDGSRLSRFAILRALAGPLDERRPQRSCRRVESVPILPREPRHGQRPRRLRHADIARPYRCRRRRHRGRQDNVYARSDAGPRRQFLAQHD